MKNTLFIAAIACMFIGCSSNDKDYQTLLEKYNMLVASSNQMSNDVQTCIFNRCFNEVCGQSGFTNGIFMLKDVEIGRFIHHCFSADEYVPMMNIPMKAIEDGNGIFLSTECNITYARFNYGSITYLICVGYSCHDINEQCIYGLRYKQSNYMNSYPRGLRYSRDWTTVFWRRSFYDHNLFLKNYQLNSFSNEFMTVTRNNYNQCCIKFHSTPNRW